MGHIFISHRRADWAFAQRLVEHLESRLPSANIFIDIKIEEDDFTKVILREVRRCDVFVLVVTDRAFDHGRIHRPEDWLRREIHEALENDKPIILAAVEECNIPSDLPSDIQPIATRQAIFFYPQMFNECVNLLAQRCITLAPEAFEIEKNLDGILPAGPVTVEQTGIVATYNNLENCSVAMREDFREAEDIRFLLQLGRKELGAGVNSIFFDEAKNKVGQPRHSIRVLRASIDSPFLSKERAARRPSKTPYSEWQDALQSVEAKISILRDSYGIHIEDRAHTEPFLWRIFLFDDVGYVSGYLHNSKNDYKAVVHKIVKGTNSLFAVFDTYFEYLWEKYRPDDVRSSIQKWANW